MTLFQWLTLLRWLFAFFLAFFVVRKFKDVLRGLIVRSLPVKYRLSEKYFDLQNRITTLSVILIATGIAIALHIGMIRLGQSVGWTWESPAPRTSATPPPPTPFAVAPVEPVPAPESIMDAMPVAEAPAAPMPAPTPGPLRGDRYYWQVEAFMEESRAWRLQRALSDELLEEVEVGAHPQDRAAYKVLIGPFSSRADATAYARARGLRGWPRRLEVIELME